MCERGCGRGGDRRGRAGGRGDDDEKKTSLRQAGQLSLLRSLSHTETLGVGACAPAEMLCECVQGGNKILAKGAELLAEPLGKLTSLTSLNLVCARGVMTEWWAAKLS